MFVLCQRRHALTHITRTLPKNQSWLNQYFSYLLKLQKRNFMWGKISLNQRRTHNRQTYSYLNQNTFHEFPKNFIFLELYPKQTKMSSLPLLLPYALRLASPFRIVSFLNRALYVNLMDRSKLYIIQHNDNYLHVSNIALPQICLLVFPSTSLSICLSICL